MKDITCKNGHHAADITPRNRSLLEKLEEVCASAHTETIAEARLAFEARLVQAVAYRMNKVLDAMTGE